jgi:hypothetical protein
MPGAYVWKKVLARVSLHIGALLGDLGRGGPSTGNFDRWMKEALGMEHFSLKRLSANGLWREGSFTGDPGRYVEKGSGYGHLSP